jgi:MFS family permease
VVQTASGSITPQTTDGPVIPSTYWVWLGGVTLSLLGTHVLGFAMAWVAAGRGGLLAGLVVTMINLPRTVLLLAGGVVGDRVGAWLTMVVGDAAMTVATILTAVTAWLLGAPAWLLLGTALVIGVVDAFYLPSSGSMPRRLVAGPGLARAMAARQLSGQFTSFAGAPLGGLIVATLGLAAAALADAATFAVMLLILVVLRTGGRLARPGWGGPARSGVWRDMVDGVRVAVADRLLRSTLLLLVVAAGLLLPVSGLVVPLLARERSWSGGATGCVAGAIALGTTCVALVVLVRGAWPRPGLAAVIGLLIAAAGMLMLAVSASSGWAVAIGVGMGAGNGLFSAHVAPLVLGRTATTHLARVQSVVGLAQSLPLLATNNLIGGLVDVVGAPAALGCCALALGIGAVAALRSAALRDATLPG